MQTQGQMENDLGKIIIDTDVIATYAGSVAVECFGMAKCAICGKGAHYGNNVSHSHRRSNRIWKSNVKSVKCIVNGTPKRLYVCTSCLRSGAVERA